MHPIVQTRQRLALYLGGWVFVSLVFAGVLVLADAAAPLPALVLVTPPTLIYGAIGLSALWVCRSAPLDRTAVGRLAATWLGSAVQASAVWVAVSTLWAVLMMRLDLFSVTRPELFTALGAVFVLGVPLYFGSLVVHYLLLAFEAARAAERRVFESQVTAREAEVRALRAQLNPHFLFNSLNSINALVCSEPEGARRMCENLGDFLRQTLALGARDSVTLAEELALVERYFAIERVRFGERLRVVCEVSESAGCCMLPPLLLQPLVENAIKHGIADRIEGGTVWISGAVDDGWLRIAVENDVDADRSKKPGAGLGLQNVRRRLDALSARDTRLDTRLEAGRYRVSLTLPARPGEPGTVGGRHDG